MTTTTTATGAMLTAKQIQERFFPGQSVRWIYRNLAHLAVRYSPRVYRWPVEAVERFAREGRSA